MSECVCVYLCGMSVFTPPLRAWDRMCWLVLWHEGPQKYSLHTLVYLCSVLGPPIPDVTIFVVRFSLLRPLYDDVSTLYLCHESIGCGSVEIGPHSFFSPVIFALVMTS